MNKTKILAEEINWQRESGMSWGEIGRLLGIYPSTAQYHGNPKYRAHKREYYKQHWLAQKQAKV